MSSYQPFNSPNFQFLAAVNSLLVELGTHAERYALDNPNTSTMKSRQLGELLAQRTAAKHGLETTFRGELAPQDSNNQPASGLLARIRPNRDAETDAKLQSQSKNKLIAQTQANSSLVVSEIWNRLLCA